MKFKKLNLNDDILKIMKELDDSFYGEDEFGFDWYKKRYTEKNYAVCLLNSRNNIVGYVTCNPVKKVFYDALVNGVIIDDLYINPDMYVEESDYYYLSSAVIMPKYRGKGYSLTMTKLAIKNKTNIVALTVSFDGFKLVSKVLRHHIKIDEKHDVLCLS